MLATLTVSPRDTTNRAGREFRNLFSCFGLEQMVTFPTHFTPHGSTSCIDVVLTDHPHLLLSVTSVAPLGASDHAQILSHLFLLPTDAVYREEPAANGHPAAAPLETTSAMFLQSRNMTLPTAQSATLGCAHLRTAIKLEI